jgi:hypothetical protein
MLMKKLRNLFGGKAAQAQQRQIEGPDGQITLKTAVAEPVPQQIVPLGGPDLQWIAGRAADAAQFLAAYQPGAAPSLRACDDAFARWQTDKGLRFTDQDVVEMLGAYLGNCLAGEFDMEWVSVTDQYGTDLAVRSRTYEILSFPFASVSKRVEKNEHDFMVGVRYAVQDMISRGMMKR